MDSNVMQFGVMNSLRTGDVLFDVMIAMCLPLVMKYMFETIFPNLHPAIMNVVQRCRGKADIATRTICVVQRTMGRGLPGQEDTRNQILQKAIAMYVGHLTRLRKHPGTRKWMEEKEFLASGMEEKDWVKAEKRLTYRSCECELKAVKEEESNTWGDYGRKWGSTHEQLLSYSIVPLPQPGEWAEVDEGVEFRYMSEESDDGDGEGKKKREGGAAKMSSTLTSTYQFQSKETDGEERLDAFISKCFEWYKAEMKRHEDDGRYMYTLAPVGTSTKSDDDNNSSGKAYKRYALSEDKSFATLFIPHKQDLIRLVDNFMKKEDKFAIQGFPHKLGLLLHGPPGTGKTSFIKCLAQYTGRHIVNVPLARISTNQELMDIMFDQRYSVPDEDMPVRLSFAQVIYVMEDIDCASDIVHTRQKATATKKVRMSPTEEEQEAQLLTRNMTEDDDADDGSQCPIDGPESSDESGGQKKKSKKKKKLGPYKSSYEDKDKLNLSGLLNVLDGVVDTPNRIVVMTSNHPEKLDPALIRPGRINKRLFLGYIRCEEAMEMIEHYFGERPDAAALKRAFKDERFTPAEVEQFCAEYDTVPALLKHLEELLESQPTRQSAGEATYKRH
eukprot:Hpha_TRINITY_DN10239_c0_g1::TRINITY_DN10239_c0_g1_i1::g.34971::m.34971/K08900/BCS1; mitochondrial chaperone BCS1